MYLPGKWQNWDKTKQLHYDNWGYPFYSLDEIEAIDPYYRIDLLMADENGCVLSVILEAKRKMADVRIRLSHLQDVSWKIRPDKYKGFCGNILDTGELSFGYQRAWVQYEYLPDASKVIEFDWHKHDGYGSESGSVDLWITLVDKRLAELENAYS